VVGRGKATGAWSPSRRPKGTAEFVKSRTSASRRAFFFVYLKDLILPKGRA
jgi:hypothetical protein